MIMSKINYDKNVAVVTGSSTGIGYETSLLLARKQFGNLCIYVKFDLKKSDEQVKIVAQGTLPLR